MSENKENIPPFEEVWENIPQDDKKIHKSNNVEFISSEFDTVSDWIKNIIQKVDGDGRKKTILIVDDEKDILDSLKELLAHEGYEIDVAINGISALDKLSHGTFDLVLSDIRMPAMDGIELCKECKANPDLNEIPVILFSAYYDEMKSCADKFLQKPLKSRLLFKVIDELI